MNNTRRLVFSEHNSAIVDWLEKLKKHLEEKCRKDFKSTANHFDIEWDVGQKWIKVWLNRPSGGRHIYCFVCPQGKIYKPEGVKRPNPIPRGDVWKSDTKLCDLHGGWLYLRRG